MKRKFPLKVGILLTFVINGISFIPLLFCQDLVCKVPLLFFIYPIIYSQALLSNTALFVVAAVILWFLIGVVCAFLSQVLFPSSRILKYTGTIIAIILLYFILGYVLGAIEYYLHPYPQLPLIPTVGNSTTSVPAIKQ